MLFLMKPGVDIRYFFQNQKIAVFDQRKYIRISHGSKDIIEKFNKMVKKVTAILHEWKIYLTVHIH